MKDKTDKTGEGRYPEWDYFDALDAILGHRPATRPPVVVNSMLIVKGRMSKILPEPFTKDELSTSTSSCATSVSPSDPQTGPLKLQLSRNILHESASIRIQQSKKWRV